MSPFLGAFACSIAAILAAAASASAGTAYFEAQTLWYEAAGEANVLTISATIDAIRVVDRGAPVVAGSGCVAAGPSEAVCPVPSEFDETRVRLGDEDDSVVVDGRWPEVNVSVFGGQEATTFSCAHPTP